jgi:hypothetical protein
LAPRALRAFAALLPAGVFSADGPVEPLDLDIRFELVIVPSTSMAIPQLVLV